MGMSSSTLLAHLYNASLVLLIQGLEGGLQEQSSKKTLCATVDAVYAANEKN